MPLLHTPAFGSPERRFKGFKDARDSTNKVRPTDICNLTDGLRAGMAYAAP